MVPGEKALWLKFRNESNNAALCPFSKMFIESSVFPKRNPSD